jgi:alpha-beta hydrolase superfamily lysophospholipase
MILARRLVEQSVNRDDRGRFLKELVVVGDRAPLAMVRKRAASRAGRPADCRAALLLVHGYGQNRYSWHLPLRSMVNHLARAGFDVFNLDLRGHGRSAHLGAPRPLAPAEFVREDVPRAVEEALRVSGRERLFLVGHSLGGLISYAAAPALAGAVAGVATVGSPYHFLRGARALALVGRLLGAAERWAALPESDVAMELRAVGEAMRLLRRFIESPLYPLPVRGYVPANIEPDVLAQSMSLAMDAGSLPVLRHMFRWARECERAGDGPGGLEGFGAAFEALTDLPLLVIAGTRDDIVPPQGVHTAYARSRSRDKTYRAFPAGHLDLLVGHTAPRTTWPAVEAWLGPRSG